MVDDLSRKLHSGRPKSFLGVAIGDKSLFVAEVIADERPRVTQLVEMAFPDGIGPQQPAELGAALKTFLAERGMTARAAIFGIPARWIVVKSKDVPPTDPQTLAQVLRLQAEAEFSTELKDLVYDFVADTETGPIKSVLLVATPQKYVDAAAALCDSAGLRCRAVMPTAVALGEATGSALAKNVLVLSVGVGGSELSSQQGGTAGTIRPLRAFDPPAAFLNDLRRTISTLPPVSPQRELIVWGGGVDAQSLGEQLGLSARMGDLPTLGVDDLHAGTNGEGHRYAAAVALATRLIGPRRLAVDFLHSRLAPPRDQQLPPWATWALYAAGAAVLIFIIAWIDLAVQQSRLSSMQAKLKGEADRIALAHDFVGKAGSAQRWLGGDPRYLSALKNLTGAIPDDGQTYATSLTISEVNRLPTAGPSTGKPLDPRALACQFYGKTVDQQHARSLVDRISSTPGFSDVNLGGTQDAGRDREVSFSITFTYTPTKNGK